jgi:hypothetical protein
MGWLHPSAVWYGDPDFLSAVAGKGFPYRDTRELSGVEAQWISVGGWRRGCGDAVAKFARIWGGMRGVGCVWVKEIR